MSKIAEVRKITYAKITTFTVALLNCIGLLTEKMIVLVIFFPNFFFFFFCVHVFFIIQNNQKLQDND